MTAPANGCPLCGSRRIRPFARAHGRDWFECRTCRLVHLAPEQRPGREAEQARYELHENDPSDRGYREFLDRLAAPLTERLPAGAEGLDYGSGPGPTLSVMLRERGFRVSIYDPFFARDDAALRRTYDFITCSETVEHFFFPRRELDRLDRLLRPGGWLGIMTEILSHDRDLEDWHYARDPTHVCFYRRHTMKWIRDHYGWSMERPHRNVTLFRKPKGKGVRDSGGQR